MTNWGAWLQLGILDTSKVQLIADFCMCDFINGWLILDSAY